MHQGQTCAIYRYVLKSRSRQVQRNCLPKPITRLKKVEILVIVKADFDKPDRLNGIVVTRFAEAQYGGFDSSKARSARDMA